MSNIKNQMKSDLIRRIKYLRKERGLSQQQLAEEMGVTQATISKIENGQIDPSIGIIRKCAIYYNVSCDYLLGVTPDKKGRTLNDDNNKEFKGHGNVSSKQYQKIIHNSLDLIYEILERCEMDVLSKNVSMVMMLSVYKLFRSLYNVNPYNPEEFYRINSTIYEDLADGEIFGIQAVIKGLLDTNSRELKTKLELSGERLINLDADAYFYLSNLISQCETALLSGHNYSL